MRTRIIRKKVKNLTTAEVRTLQSLSFRSQGLMSSQLTIGRHHVLEEYRPNKFRWVESDHEVFVIKREDNVIIAWALIFKEEKDWCMFMYTRRSYRHQGYGQRLHRAIRKAHPKDRLRFYPHDRVSQAFADSLSTDDLLVSN